MKEEKPMSLKQRDQMIGYCSSIEVDDSWITQQDKIDLLKFIKHLYSKKHEWADDILMKCLIKKHYNDVINNMNKEDYLKEKAEETTSDLIDRL
tara:strand:+ start:370 stop:651 length:282 start_codon:yes stop_codon:yes gene_type:complete